MTNKQHDVSSYVMSFVSEKCGVCHSIEPQLKEVLKEYTIPLIEIDITKDQWTSGQHRVFTVPTILVFAEGKEILRESRFIDLHKVERSLDFIKSNGL